MDSSEPPPTAVLLRPPYPALARHPGLYGSSPPEQVAALAAALASSPGWARLRSRATLALRTSPRPLLAVAGHVHEEDTTLLRALDWQVQDSLARLLPVSYRDVEDACSALADRLREQAGAQALDTCRIVPVPRGGVVVAGILSYVLGLVPSQLTSVVPETDEMVIVVDDCVLSGARTRRWLHANPGPPVVLAHLHSHPDLRKAAMSDPRVTACLSAADLHDHAPAMQGARYEQWLQRWRKRSPDDYWTGHPDHVCYPWNEPDMVVWNQVSGVGEPGWHVVPPAACLKNRLQSTTDLQDCSAQPGADRVPANVLWAELADGVVLVDADAGSTTALEGTAADFWRAMVATVSSQAAVTVLLERYAVSRPVLTSDLDEFMQQMGARGLWESPGG